MSRKAFTVKFLVYSSFVIVMLGIIFCVVYKAAHPADQHIDSGWHNDNETAQGRDKIAGIQQISPEPNDQTAKNQQRTFRIWLSKWFEPITILTFTLVVGVGITNYIYYGQLKKMRETVALVAQQSGTMKDQLSETRNLVQQNERALTIAKSQTEIMQASHVVTTRSYMDVFRIETMNRERPAIVIKIGNIGAVPAENIHGFIDVLFSKRKDSTTLIDISPTRKRFPFDFQRTKLFRGKLKMKIQAPIYEFLSPVEILNVFSGDADLVAQIMIEYRDGFSRDFRSETFAFRFDDEGGGWFTHPVPIQYSEIEHKALQLNDGYLMSDSVETKVNGKKGETQKEDQKNRKENPN
jgi:hypothetical protein